MKVFISWSGEASNQIAAALKSWLPLVIQRLDPFMSQLDIPNGADWGSTIAKELMNTYVGIICLTPDNLNSTWMHFEAGALAKDMQTGRACTYLHQVDPSTLRAPLGIFPANTTTREGTKKLVADINGFLAQSTTSGDKPLDKEVLGEVFDAHWPKLEKALNEVKRQAAAPPRPTTEEMLSELIQSNLEIQRTIGRLSDVW
jgi:hypothetical protein